MDLKKWKQKINTGFRKYRYAALIAIIGVILMLIPGKNTKSEELAEGVNTTPKQITVEQKLEEILSCISGAGDVAVMLTHAQGEITVYQTDHSVSDSENESNTKTDTIIISDAQRQQNGLIKQVNPPVYLGAIILCEGADSPTVRLSIVEAVSKVTGLGADRISVLKMK